MRWGKGVISKIKEDFFRPRHHLREEETSKFFVFFIMQMTSLVWIRKFQIDL